MDETVQNVLANPGLSVRIGRWWFQRRSFSPIPLFLLLVLLKPETALNLRGYVVSLTLLFLAEALRIWAVGYAGSRTRTRGDSVPELVHAGPYRFVRNPLYIANIVLYTAAGALFGFSYLAGFIFIYSVIQYSFIVAYEEGILLQTFGKEYENYRLAVPRWLPDLDSTYPASSHTFDLRKALRSERSTFFSMAAMAVLFTLKKALR